MPKWLGTLIQVILLAGQAENFFGSLIPADIKWIVMAALGAAQVIAHAVQAHYNPDGTAATTAYVPK
jgi:hypothetical protein